MQTATVTHLKPTRSAQILAECRKQADARLPETLKFVLTQADNALFELANNADSSDRQNLYFDAMRELRIVRPEFETAFLEHFDTNFADSLDLAKLKTAERGFEPEGELSLVGIDDVEQTLAVTNFAETMRTRSREELFALDKRVGVLIGVPDLDDDDNPLGPKAIGDALRAACALVHCDVEVKLTLFKLFDKYASHAIHQFYQDINRSLVQADVLPDINAGAARPAASRRRTRVIIESEQDSTEAAGEDVFSTLRQLMYGNPASGGPGTALGGPGFSGAGGGSPLAAGVPGGVSVRATGSVAPGGFVAGVAVDGGAFAGGGTGGAGLAGAPLVQGLTVLQRGGAGAAGGGAGGTGSVFNAIDLAQVAAGNVNVLHSLRETGAFAGAGQNESLTLEIVSLLFDYILEDPAIPDALKALIGRLQIPVLKVALLDRDVFSKKQHPARRLLDELARASIGWSEGLRQQDELYDKVEQVVNRIVDEFEDDVGLFEIVLEDFLAFVTSQATAADERAEQSTRSLHTKERIIKAKMEVDDEINTRFAENNVREFISNFILDFWRQLLIITLIESGRDSEAWTAQLQVLDDLLWSVEPKTTADDRRALTSRLPRLVKDIKAGMQELEMDPAECSRFLSTLASVHVVAIKNVEESSIAERKLAEAESRIAEERARAEEASQVDPSSEEFIKKGLARILEKQNVEEVELDIDFSLLEAAEEEEEPGPEMADSNIMQFIEMVGTLDLGDWVEIADEQGSTLRARFTWISPDTGRYLFTTRDGKRALDTTMQELAVEFQQGRAKIVKADPDPLFDRALGDLIEKLEAGGTLA